MNNFQARPINPFRIGTGFTGEPPAPIVPTTKITATTNIASQSITLNHGNTGATGFSVRKVGEAVTFIPHLNLDKIIVFGGVGTYEVWPSTGATTNSTDSLKSCGGFTGKTVDFTEFSASLTDITLTGGFTTSALMTNCSAVTSFQCSSATSLTTLAMTGMTSLDYIQIDNCPALTALDLTGIPSGVTKFFWVHDNASLASIVLPSGFLSRDHSVTCYYELYLINNALTGTALDAMYTAAGDATSWAYQPQFNVAGNVGTATHDPTICTATKNWVVIQ